MKYLMLLTALCCSVNLFAQYDGPEWKTPSKESQAYNEYRNKSTVPPYGLAKVKALVKSIPWADDETARMDNKTYLALSLREKFTYVMIHPEISSQNCDPIPPVQDEDKKIFGRLPDAFSEANWSERQINFLNSNRDSVMAIIRESVIRSKRMGVNYKNAIQEINGREMIPFLIDTYNTDKKDHDILSLLMLLMMKSEYTPFMTSQSYRKLYGPNADFRAYIDFNGANEELILKRATDFYSTIRK
ncbi:hypothetical protein [Chitinophaga solisilvae]|uniref:hypothetical protein n=1 Tax=Chitinophaga solisilvae TaxID=1233460 RepID=UPI00136EAAC5|nr:hypothetical protein [Chitinophaga solisilvae]